MLRCFDEIDSIMIQVIPCLFSINRVSPLLIFQSIPSLCPYHPLWLCFSSPFMYVVWIYSNLACDRQMSRVSRGRLCELCSPRCSLNHYRLQHQTWRILPPICRYIVNSPCSSQEVLCFYFVQCVVPISNSILTQKWFPTDFPILLLIWWMITVYGCVFVYAVHVMLILINFTVILVRILFAESILGCTLFSLCCVFAHWKRVFSSSFCNLNGMQLVPGS